MKSDRRHELQTNELADWLGQRIDELRPHAGAITLGIVAVVTLFIGGVWYFSGSSRGSARVWSDFFSAFNTREPAKALEKLAAEHIGTKPALWALQATGDMSLSQGAAQLFSDRAEAQKLLQKAETAYKQVEAAATGDPLLQARARLGLAKVYESLCKPEDARKYYELVAETQKGTPLGELAAADVKRLKDERQLALLAWFAEQTPKKPAPVPGLGGGLPGLPGSLPDQPDIGLPGAGGLPPVGGLPPASGTESPPAPPAAPASESAAPGAPSESTNSEPAAKSESPAAKSEAAAPTGEPVKSAEPPAAEPAQPAPPSPEPAKP
jgi:hypothetical protein